MGFRMLRSAAALAAVMLLAGCVPGEPVVTPEPDPDVTPVFASDEEALAAAIDAYTKYLEVSNLIRRERGTDPERISSFVTSQLLQSELEGFAKFSDRGIAAVGDVTADSYQLQQFSQLGEGRAEVTIYACMDATQVTFVDSAGTDVTTTAKPGRDRFEIRFESSADDPALLLLSGSELWDQDSVC